jgi:hypothetical protein
MSINKIDFLLIDVVIRPSTTPFTQGMTLTREQIRWRTWVLCHGQKYPEIVESMYTSEQLKELREYGIVFRLREPAAVALSPEQKGARWSIAIFEKSARAAAARRWPALKQEIIAGAFHPSRIQHLIEKYGFDALDQFE